MTEEINRLVHFKQYNLPEIVNADPEKLEDSREKTIERIFLKNVYTQMMKMQLKLIKKLIILLNK